MSTRGVVTFVLSGVERTVYNHHDSYPDGLGSAVLAWVRSIEDLDVVRSQVAALRPVDDDLPFTAEDLARFSHLHDPDVSSGSDWYALLRRTQGKPALILETGVYESAESFPLDSLFCEWAYVVDLDAEVVEVYGGFQTPPPRPRSLGTRPRPAGGRVLAGGPARVVADLRGASPQVRRRGCRYQPGGPRVPGGGRPCVTP